MQGSVCLIVCLILLSVGVNKATEDMLEDNGLNHERFVRGTRCVRPCYASYDCCSGWRCSYGKCRPKYIIG
uniref:CRP-I28 n=1 Tax=Mytilus galloprovincialis TaxID=29158 RepID=A0A0K0NJY9_MYTGA|nr:CRP-I28 [Mytilus galloprovincialis]